MLLQSSSKTFWIYIYDNNQSHFAFKDVNNYATVKYGNLLLWIIIGSMEKNTLVTRFRKQNFEINILTEELKIIKN